MGRLLLEYVATRAIVGKQAAGYVVHRLGQRANMQLATGLRPGGGGRRWDKELEASGFGKGSCWRARDRAPTLLKQGLHVRSDERCGEREGLATVKGC